MKNTIDEILSLIPDQTLSEALMSIQTITKLSPESARLSCFLSQKFKLFLSVDRNSNVTISIENRPDIIVDRQNFITALSREIYEIDEAMSCGDYKQSKSSSPFIFIPLAPENMDLPVWDEDQKKWYDAEC